MSGKYFKEVIIGILLVILIIILLIILLYEYTPSQKAISGIENYQRTPETANTLQEISTSDLATQNNESIIKSYSITSSDLTNYESYDKGRENPFADVAKEEITNTTNTVTPGTPSNTVKNTTNTSTGYFNSTGKNK